MYLSSRAATYEPRESCWIDSVRRACFETGTVKSRRGELVCRKLGASVAANETDCRALWEIRTFSWISSGDKS